MKKWMPGITIMVLCLFALSSNAQKNAVKKTNEKEESLKPYFLVLLKKGPHRDQDSATAAHIQKMHLEHINEMAQSGKLNVAGPFLDEGELRGIFVFDSNSEEEVRKIVDADPAVKSGRLTYEIHPWMTQKGTCFK